MTVFENGLDFCCDILKDLWIERRPVWRKFEYFEYFLPRFSLLSCLFLVSLSPLFFDSFCQFFLIVCLRKKPKNGRRRTDFSLIMLYHHGKICFYLILFTFKGIPNRFLFQERIFTCYYSDRIFNSGHLGSTTVKKAIYWNESIYSLKWSYSRRKSWLYLFEHTSVIRCQNLLEIGE